MNLEEQRACMDSLQLAGLLIMENGGETYRVEETITRMGQAFGLEEVESFAVPSGLFISYKLCDGSVETSVKRVRRGGNNLSRVDRVNDISRRVERDHLSPAQAMEELRHVQETAFPEWLLAVGAGLCAGGFTWMFGGAWLDCLFSFLIGGLICAGGWLLGRLHFQSFLTTVLGGLLTALIPRFLTLLIPGLRMEAVIGGALMPMLPGLTMTNAVQDMMRGDMVSGLSHGVQAILIAALVAGSALVADALFRFMMGGGL